MSYIDALLEVGRTLGMRKQCLTKLRINGARGEGFDKLQHKLVRSSRKSHLKFPDGGI